MHLIDHYAYSNRIHKLHPGYKASYCLCMLILCLGINRLPVSLLILLFSLFLTIFWAGLPVRYVLHLSLVEGGFLFFGVVGVAISVSSIPTPGAYPLGSVWFNVNRESVIHAIQLLTRAFACVSAMNFLALTTPVIDLIDLFHRLHVPDILIDIMGLMYRFIFVLFDSLERMVQANQVRLGFVNWRSSFHSAAQIGANLFIEAFRRSQRLETALQGRVWEGSFRVLPREYECLAQSLRNLKQPVRMT